MLRGRGEFAQRQFAGEHFVEHHAQRVDVRAVVHVCGLLDLLRRHVVRRAHDLPVAGERGVAAASRPEDLGDAEVGDLHPALLVEQDVLRLDVAVDDAFVVRELERLADLRDDRQRLARAQACPRCSSCRRFTPSTYSMRR